MQEIVFKIFAESFDRFSTVINRHVNRKELPLHKEQKNMRKLKITELNRISAEEFKKADKLPLVVILDDIRSCITSVLYSVHRMLFVLNVFICVVLRPLLRIRKCIKLL